MLKYTNQQKTAARFFDVHFSINTTGDFNSIGDRRTRQKVLQWIADGNLPIDPDPPAPPTQDELDAIAAKQYAKLIALKAMTPAQVDAWITANVNNLADAKDSIKTLAIAVSVLARRL